MALYFYRALDKDGTLIEGSGGGKSEEEVADTLRKKGLRPVSIKETKSEIQIKGTLPAIEKITFCRYISSMLSSGLSLSEGVDVLQEETRNPLMRKILSDISYSLEHGQQLSSVFARYPNVFDSFFLTLVGVGEVSGKLADVFVYLEKGLRAEYSLNQKIKSALLYPTVVFLAMMAVGFLMFFFVLPQIGKVFLNMKLELPLFTRTLFIVSLSLAANTIPIIIGLAAGVVSLILILRTPSGKKTLLRLVSRIPVVKDLLSQIDLARFTRIFSTLVRSAVPITQSLEIALDSFSSSRYRMSISPIKKSVIEGKPLSVSFKKQQVFPALLIQMLAAGEKTGTLDKSLEDLALFYEEKVEEEVKNATQILEPVLILLVGISVGAMILSIIAPIYSVVSSLSNITGK